MKRLVSWVYIDGWRLGFIERDGDKVTVTTFAGVERMKYRDLLYKDTEEDYDERFFNSLKRHSKIVDSPVSGTYTTNNRMEADDEVVISN